MQVLNDATAAGHPALGASFTFLTDATVWLARLPGQDHEMRTAQVLRSRISVRIHPRSSLECINSQSLSGDRGALFVSDTAWESAGDLSFDKKYSDFSLGNRLCFLAYVASTRSPSFGSKSLTFVW